MYELLTTIWLCLLLAFLLGLLIGWLIKHFCAQKKLKQQQQQMHKECEEKRKSDQERIQDLSEELTRVKRLAAQEQYKVVPEVAPDVLHQDRPTEVDDLKEVKGIGPILEKTLHDLGIYQFSQLANLSEENVEWVASHINTFSSRIYTDRWIEQAKELEKKK